MNVKVTFEFPSIEHAISWLGTKVMAGAPLQVKAGAINAGSGTGADPKASLPPSVAPATPKRKGRADKGKPRGSYKDKGQVAKVVDAPHTGTQGSAAEVSTAGSSPALPTYTAVAAPIPAEGDKPQPSGTLSGAAAPSATQEEVQALFEKVFNQKGMKTGRDLLSRYGIKRMPELPKEMYGEFAQHAKTVLEGGEV